MSLLELQRRIKETIAINRLFSQGKLVEARVRASALIDLIQKELPHSNRADLIKNHGFERILGI